ncbi:MAG: TolC family protein, partial [Acidobacteriota bacterium]
MMRFSIERWLLGLALLLTAACTVGPDYYPPAPTTDPAFDSVFSDAVTKPGTAEPTIYEAAEPEVAWWSQLDDPLLDALIERALRANHDLQVARANVRRARALLGEDRLRRYPIASTSAAAQERRSSAVELPVGADQDVTLYSVDLDATWELDLFGRVRRSIEARTADAEA